MATKYMTCKSCGEPVVKGSKTCPHCGAKQKKSKALPILLVLLVLALIGAIAGGGNSKEPSGTKVNTPESQQTDTQKDPAKDNNTQTEPDRKSVV